MNIFISNTSSTPLYEQIVQQIKDAILSGQLSQGASLPSIRFLAKELKVSIITTKRAYEELERQGFLQTIPGKGTFVSIGNRERLREIASAQMEEQLASVVQSAKSIQMDYEELEQILKLLWEDLP